MFVLSLQKSVLRSNLSGARTKYSNSDWDDGHTPHNLVSSDLLHLAAELTNHSPLHQVNPSSSVSPSQEQCSDSTLAMDKHPVQV